MIRIDDLEVKKGGRTICRVPELNVASTERLAIVGPNGSGKSTLLRVLAGMETDFRGSCEVDATLRDRSYVHQHPFLFRGTVLSNTVYGLRLHGMRKHEANALAEQLLNSLGLYEQRMASAKHLSGGERRRVALARAFALKPTLLLLDEPFAELDSSGIAMVCSLLASMQSTVVIASPQSLPRELAASEFELSADDKNANSNY